MSLLCNAKALSGFKMGGTRRATVFSAALRGVMARHEVRASSEPICAGADYAAFVEGRLEAALADFLDGRKTKRD